MKVLTAVIASLAMSGSAISQSYPSTQRLLDLHRMPPSEFGDLEAVGQPIAFDHIDSALLDAAVFHETNRRRAENDLPAVAEKNVSLLIGAPLNFGFLAGRDRYNYGGTIPDGMLEKRAAIKKVCDAHKVDLRVAALQFSNAPKAVTAVIPGARNAEQATENAKALETAIPADFWAELKKEKLISASAEVPAQFGAPGHLNSEK